MAIIPIGCCRIAVFFKMQNSNEALLGLGATCNSLTFRLLSFYHKYSVARPYFNPGSSKQHW